MTFSTLIYIVIVNILVAFFMNKIFLYNKTSYLLIGSIFLFMFASIIFFTLELEFLAITFSMIYVGGIAVMFLFLILVVDVNIENVEGTKLVDLKFVDCLIISLISIILTFILYINFDIFLFNEVEIFFIDNVFEYNNSNYLYNEFLETLYDLYFIQNYPLNLVNFLDLWILSFILFKSFYVVLMLMAYYLFVAIVVSLIFCSNTFEKFINIRF